MYRFRDYFVREKSFIVAIVKYFTCEELYNVILTKIEIRIQN